MPTTTGYLTPLIISAVPFFSLAYTFMLSRLSNSRIDLDELEESLSHKQRVKEIREKYQANVGQRASTALIPVVSAESKTHQVSPDTENGTSQVSPGTSRYRDQIRELILSNPSISNREIVGTVGCGESTAKRLAAEIRKELLTPVIENGHTHGDTDPLVLPVLELE